MGSVKRIFAGIRSIINLVMREYGIEGSNAFSQTYMPDKNELKTANPSQRPSWKYCKTDAEI